LLLFRLYFAHEAKEFQAFYDKHFTIQEVIHENFEKRIPAGIHFSM